LSPEWRRGWWWCNRWCALMNWCMVMQVVHQKSV